MAKKDLEALKKTWEGRATEDAMYYIDTDVTDQNADKFFENGEKDISRFLDPFLKKYQIDPSSLSIIDLGCGMGRLSRALGKRFASVHGFDISEEMIRKAKSMLGSEEQHIQYHLTSGDGFRSLPDASIDMLFSYIVLQHVPTESIVANYLKDLARVLKPGSYALIQINGERRSFFQRLKIRWAKSQKVPILHRKLVVKLDPHSTMGVTFTEQGIKSLAVKSGLKALEVSNPGQQYMWIEIQK